MALFSSNDKRLPPLFTSFIGMPMVDSSDKNVKWSEIAACGSELAYHLHAVRSGGSSLAAHLPLLPSEYTVQLNTEFSLGFSVVGSG